MAFNDPYGANYGRTDRGQLSPFRDTARRRQPFEEDEQEQMQQMPPPEAAPPLAQAVAPRQSFQRGVDTFRGDGSVPQQESPLAQAVKPRQQPLGASATGGAFGSRGILPTGSAHPLYGQKPKSGSLGAMDIGQPLGGDARRWGGVGGGDPYRVGADLPDGEFSFGGYKGDPNTPQMSPEEADALMRQPRDPNAMRAMSAVGGARPLNQPPPDGGLGPTPGFLSPEELAAVGAQDAATQQPGGGGYSLSSIGGAGGGNNQYAGFDFGQDAGNRDTGKSAKYAFAQLSGEAGAAMPTTKQGAEEWFRTYIAPGMNALGHEVLDVKGDKALIRNWQGEGWVDFLQNADGANPMLAWQAEGGGGDAPMDPLATAIGGGVADPAAHELAKMLGIDTSNPMWKQILDQLIADQSGTAENQQHASTRV